MTYLVGIDAGLTNVTAGVFDSDGREVAVAAEPTPDERPAPGRAEQDLDELWTAVRTAIRRALREADVDASAIEGVGVAGHGHGLYLLDDAGDPVRNGIKSTDSRAVDVVEQWAEAGLIEDAFSITGYEPFAGDPLSLLAWIRDEEPDVYTEIDTVLFCKDYVKYRLTDALCTDEMEASAFFDLDRETYSDELFDLLGLDACRDALPEIVPSRESCGEVTLEAAAATELDAGTPVASGLHDVGATALGAGVHREGRAMLIVGTWGQSIVVQDEPRPDRDVGGITRRYLDDRWLCYKGNRSATRCLDWFLDEFAVDWQRAADREGTSVYDRCDRAVDGVPPGAGGVLFHPYLDGSTDRPSARGGFYGLSSDHTRDHLLRAVYEGVAIEQAERLAELVRGNVPTEIRIGGGGSRSEVWMDVFADVLDERLAVPAGTEFGARGAALCAGIATDLYADPADAVDRTVRVEREHAPNPENVETYRTMRTIYERAADDAVPTWKRLRDAGLEEET